MKTGTHVLELDATPNQDSGYAILLQSAGAEAKTEEMTRPKKTRKRVYRTDKLTPAQAARDEKFRAMIEAEHPPFARPPIPRSLSAPLKKAMKQDAKMSYQIAKEAGLSQNMISRFLSGKRDIRLATADRLTHALGLKLVAG